MGMAHEKSQPRRLSTETKSRQGEDSLAADLDHE